MGLPRTLTQGTTHVDVGGEDTGALAVAACGQGRPQPENVQALRTLAAAWAHDLASGRRSDAFFPGGEFVEALLAAQRARSIECAPVKRGAADARLGPPGHGPPGPPVG